MEAMAAAAPTDGAKPLDLGGERGEYHTMVLDGPLYARPVHARVARSSSKDSPAKRPASGGGHSS